MLNQQIIDNLKSKFKEINEFKKVFEWLERPLTEKETPSLILRDPTDKVDDGSVGHIENHTLTVEVDLVVSPEKYEARVIRELIPKVKKALKEVFETEDFYYPWRYRGRTIIGEHRDYYYIASRLTFYIDYETEKGEE